MIKRVYVLHREKYMNVYLTLEGGYTSSVEMVYLRFRQEKYKLLIEDFNTENSGLKYTKKLYKGDELLAKVEVNTKIKPMKIEGTFNREVELHRALEMRGLLAFRDFNYTGVK